MRQIEVKPRQRGRLLLMTGATLAALGLAAAMMPANTASAAADSASPRIDTPYVVFGYNDLGMHCMNSDFSELMVLPPFNTLHGQLIRRGREPDIETSSGDFVMRYFFPSNTYAAGKTNFWDYWQPWLGQPRPANIGLAGNGLDGTMTPTASRDWSAVGIPLVPIDDNGKENPYPLATIEVRRRDSGAVVARTQAVAPVSTEMSCNLCHNTPGVTTATDILMAHDRLHETNLMELRPVLCASCHGSAALGIPSPNGMPNVSQAIHTAHFSRMDAVNIPEKCYACHPGVRTNCQRDNHAAAGITCTQCHGDMLAVGSPNRRAWIDEPRCGDCHSRPGFEFEQPGVLYRDSVGHGGVHCSACHGSPHAMGPAVTERDNVQAMQMQGHSGVINDCTVCHGAGGPPGAFFHRRED